MKKNKLNKVLAFGICVCVCVCEREREREREKSFWDRAFGIIEANRL